MSITCDCSVDVDETFDVSTTNIRKAQKEYYCYECGQPITPSQKYECVQGAFGGRWWTFRTCLPCAAIRNRHCPKGFEFGRLREIIMDCLGMDYITGKLASWAVKEDNATK